MEQIKVFINLPEQKKSRDSGRLGAELSGIKKELRSIKKLSGKNRMAKKSSENSDKTKSNLLLNELRTMRGDMKKTLKQKGTEGSISNPLSKQLRNLNREIRNLPRGIKKEFKSLEKSPLQNKLLKKSPKSSIKVKSNLLLNELRGLRTDMRKNKGHKTGPGNSHLLAKQLGKLSREIGGLAHSSHVGGG